VNALITIGSENFAAVGICEDGGGDMGMRAYIQLHWRQVALMGDTVTWCHTAWICLSW
jgi:hypothetical protein